MTENTLTNAEIVDRFSRVPNKGTAMRAVIGLLEESLKSSFPGAHVVPYTKREDTGVFEPSYENVVKGYYLAQTVQLDNPIVTKRKTWFGFGKEITETQTHATRNLVYGAIGNGSNLPSQIGVLTNNSDVVKACEEVAVRAKIPVYLQF